MVSSAPLTKRKCAYLDTHVSTFSRWHLFYSDVYNEEEIVRRRALEIYVSIRSYCLVKLCLPHTCRKIAV